MGFTNVVWESRSPEQLAHDLATGPGPGSVGEAGAAWIRIANELAKVSADYDRIIERLGTSWNSEASTAVARKLVDFGRWLQATSLGAAANGRRIEEAAVANTVAILSMPSVSEAVEARVSQEMMASLAAYNGAILNGGFAELDEAATSSQAEAAAVMNRYEDAVAELAVPWEQPLPPQVTNGDALKAEKEAKSGRGGKGHGGGGGGGAARQLTPAAANMVKASDEAKTLKKTGFSGGSGGSNGGMGRGGYGPMGAMGARGNGSDREHESIRPAAALEGGGEPGAGLSDGGQSWLPAAQQNDSPFSVSNVSWGPNTAIFDDLAAPEPARPEGFADEPHRTLEQVSDRWVSPPVIGADHEATL